MTQNPSRTGKPGTSGMSIMTPSEIESARAQHRANIEAARKAWRELQERKSEEVAKKKEEAEKKAASKSAKQKG